MSFLEEEFSGDTFDLDNLLAESVKEQQAKEQNKKHREQLSKSFITHKERKEIEKKVVEWESVREWIPQADVAYFDVQTCQCGNIHTHFRGFFQKQQHRFSSTVRYVKVDSNLNVGLLKEKKLEYYPVECCINCATVKGYV